MKKSFPPFYMNVKHVLFTTSATRFDLFEEIVTLVVYQNECREVFYFDLQIASMPNSGYSTHSMLLMLF